MLILGRKIGESLFIRHNASGEELEVVNLGRCDHYISDTRIGFIDDDKSFTILRSELKNRDDSERAEAIDWLLSIADDSIDSNSMAGEELKLIKVKQIMERLK